MIVQSALSNLLDMQLPMNDAVRRMFAEAHRLGHHGVDDVWRVVASRGVALRKDMVEVVCAELAHFA